MRPKYPLPDMLIRQPLERNLQIVGAGNVEGLSPICAAVLDWPHGLLNPDPSVLAGAFFCAGVSSLISGLRNTQNRSRSRLCGCP
jgi:hypothetical protein